MKKLIYFIWLALVASFSFIWSFCVEQGNIGDVLVLLISLLTLVITIAYGQFTNLEKEQDMTKYLLIQWPESEKVLEIARQQGWQEECFLAVGLTENQDKFLGDQAYFVPVGRYSNIVNQ